MQGFSQWGDKLFASITGICALLTTQAQALQINARAVAWITFAAAVATLLHTIVFPNSTANSIFTPSSKQSGRARLSFLALLTLFGLGILGLIVGCATTSGASLTFNQQVYIGLAAADGIAKTTDQLLTAGTISSPTAQKVETADQYFLTAIEAAQTTYQTNQANGSNALITALSALATIQACVAAPSSLATCALPGTSGGT